VKYCGGLSAEDGHHPSTNGARRRVTSLTRAVMKNGVELWFNAKIKLECGPMPNVMVALRNIGGALCSTPQSLPDAHY